MWWVFGWKWSDGGEENPGGNAVEGREVGCEQGPLLKLYLLA